MQSRGARRIVPVAAMYKTKCWSLAIPAAICQVTNTRQTRKDIDTSAVQMCSITAAHNRKTAASQESGRSCARCQLA